MKYKITEETMQHKGITLYRIQALVDIPSIGVKAGDLGGWIAGEHNLSQEGDAWVCGNAKVYENAWVYGNAMACGWAKVYDNAKVYGNAKVCGWAVVFGNAEVCGDAKVYGDAEVSGYTVVCD